MFSVAGTDMLHSNVEMHSFMKLNPLLRCRLALMAVHDSITQNACYV